MSAGEVAGHFGTLLRQLREKAGITQAELAERAKLTRDGVAQLELGRRKPAWETVLALCAALGCSCEAFAVAPPADAPPASPGKRGRPRRKPADG